MPIKMTAEIDSRGLDRKLARLDNGIFIRAAVRGATEAIKDAVSVRTGALKKSIKGKVLARDYGVVTARFSLFPHLAQKQGRKRAAIITASEGAHKEVRRTRL